MIQRAMNTERAASENNLDHALHYSAKGWHVLPLQSIVNGKCSCNKPCKSPGKHPRTRNGLRDATLNETTIRKWWTTWPDANIGIATGKQSNLVVLDVDPAHGGKISLDDLTTTHSTFETLSQVTGGNGWHYLFQYPETLETIKNSVGTIGKGLDVRANGGYIVAPPSNHNSGNTYHWENKKPPSSIPAWLLSLITEKPVKSTCESEYVTEGNRNDYLTRIGGKLRNNGKNKKELEIALLEENRLKCRPPLVDSEVSNIAKSISRYPIKPKPFIYVWRERLLSEQGPKAPTTRLVLLALSTHMDKDGRSCFPTIEQQTIETRLSNSCVRKHLKLAEKENWIDIYTHSSKGQAWRNHGYIARISC